MNPILFRKPTAALLLKTSTNYIPLVPNSILSHLWEFPSVAIDVSNSAMWRGSEPSTHESLIQGIVSNFPFFNLSNEDPAKNILLQKSVFIGTRKQPNFDIP